MWTAITGPRRDEAFFNSNLDRINDFVSEAIMSCHPKGSQLSNIHTQAWQIHATEALGKDKTYLSPTPVVSIVFAEPYTKWSAVYNASKASTVTSRLTPINTATSVRKCKNERWIFPPNRSAFRGSGTGNGDGSSRRAVSSGWHISVNPESLARRREEVDIDGCSGDEED